MNNEIENNTDFYGNINNSTENQYLTFVIEDEDYGIEIENITEIITMTQITQIPHTQSFLKGIINLRGEVIPVIDVRERFKKEIREYDGLTCIVVIEFKEYSMGLIVDRVKEVMFIQESSMVTPPNEKYSYYNQFIKGIGKSQDGLKLILDLEKLLSNE